MPASTIIDVTRQIQIGSRIIHDGSVFTDVIVKSSNVSAIVDKLGPERLALRPAIRLRPADRPDFPSENPGIVWGARSGPTRFASVSMGYGVGDPLRMAAAVSSIANGGVIKPGAAAPSIARDALRRETEGPSSRDHGRYLGGADRIINR
jgi:cell division protein FtsI/penicillin-binding protein 2